jgi:hypothetical protein
MQRTNQQLRKNNLRFILDIKSHDRQPRQRTTELILNKNTNNTGTTTPNIPPEKGKPPSFFHKKKMSMADGPLPQMTESVLLNSNQPVSSNVSIANEIRHNPSFDESKVIRRSNFESRSIQPSMLGQFSQNTIPTLEIQDFSNYLQNKPQIQDSTQLTKMYYEYCQSLYRKEQAISSFQ